MDSGAKLDGWRDLGWKGKSNMVTNQNVWTGEQVANMDKEPEKNLDTSCGIFCL